MKYWLIWGGAWRQGRILVKVGRSLETRPYIGQGGEELGNKAIYWPLRVHDVFFIPH